MKRKYGKIWMLAMSLTYLLSIVVIASFCLLIFLISSILCLWLNSGTVLSIILMAIFILFFLFMSTVVYEILDNCGVLLRIYERLKLKVEQKSVSKENTKELNIK